MSTAAPVSIIQILTSNDLNQLCDLNTRNNQGQTALHIAIEKENFQHFKALVDSSAKLTLKDQNGNTPLHYSIIGHRDDMLSILIQQGVDPGIINQGFLFIYSHRTCN